MKKSYIAVAVGLALAAQFAQADTYNVNVYGRIRAAVEVVSGAGSAAGKNSTRQTRVVDNSSVLGFKGNEDLGAGLILQWQAEGQLESDGDSDGKLNSRNTYLALKHDTWGTVLVGKNDSPYKLASASLRATPLADTTAELPGLLNRGEGQNFYTRQSSTVQYLSPKWSGFDFKLGFAPDEAKTSTRNKTRISGAVGYEFKGFFANAAFENRADTTGTTAAEAVLFSGGYAFDKKGQVTVLTEKITLGSKDQTNFFLSGAYKIAEKWTVGGHYGQAGETSSGANDDATQLGVSAAYDFSKRTSVVAYYGKIENSSAGTYNFSDNAIDQLVTGNAPSVAGLGLNVKF